MEPVMLAFMIHMIIVGYSYGSDFVVDQRTFLFMRSTDVAPTERTRLLHSLLMSDQHPRMVLILFIVTGYTVEILGGWSPFGPDMLPVI